MTAVATKPRAVKKPAAKKVAALPPPVLSEGDELAMKAAQCIVSITTHIVEGPATGAFPGRNEVEDADATISAVASWADPFYRPASGDSISDLLRIALDEFAAARDAVRGGTHDVPGWGMAHAALLDLAFDQTQRLIDAYNGLPHTIEDLRKLATFNGALPHRDPPRPPIRREPVPEETAAARVVHSMDVYGGYAYMQTATALLNLWLSANDDGAIHGVAALMSIAESSTEKATCTTSGEAIRQALNDLHNAEGVLQVIAETYDILPIWGVLYLLWAVIEKVEGAGEGMPHA